MSPSAEIFGSPGVIEGFYGRPWPQAERLQTLAWLPAAGFGSYVYAPKSDAWLRRDWRASHPAAEWEQLVALRRAARVAGVRFGIGFSPWGLQQRMTPADAAALRLAIGRLNALEPDLLCILFDDMPGGNADLAVRQLAVTAEILAVSTAPAHAVCPTYYSRDAILEQLFGPCPADYLQTLGSGLPERTAILWTGPRVVSSRYQAEDFEWVRSRSRQPVVLWDNSAANDGRLGSRYLRLRPMDSHPAALRNWCDGHLVNPMNQAALARLVVAWMGDLYRHPSRSADDAWQALIEGCAPALGKLLERDASRFQALGLDSLEDAERQRMSAEYAAAGGAAAREVAAWLRGDYAFDPACLND